MNWKLRLNAVTISAVAALLLTLVYQVLGVLGIEIPVAEDQLLSWVAIVLEILVLIGVLHDPTTEGLSDSARALKYKEQGK